MLSRGIETISPRIQDQHEADLSSGRVQLTSDSATRKISSRSDKSRKFTTTVRNFGSSVDDDSTHIREPGGSGKENNSGRVVEMNYQREYFEEDEEELETSNYPSPIQDPSPSQSGTLPLSILSLMSCLEVVTKDTLQKMERSYRRYFDSKSVSIQIHTLCVCVIFTFLNVLYHLRESSLSPIPLSFQFHAPTETRRWSYPLARFFVFVTALAIARSWLPYREYSQEILLLTELLTLVTKIVESLLAGSGFGSIPITILCTPPPPPLLSPPSHHHSRPLCDDLPQDSLPFHSRLCLLHSCHHFD
jgi:hypothetical protein